MAVSPRSSGSEQAIGSQRFLVERGRTPEVTLAVSNFAQIVERKRRRRMDVSPLRRIEMASSR